MPKENTQAQNIAIIAEVMEMLVDRTVVVELSPESLNSVIAICEVLNDISESLKTIANRP